MIIKKCNFGSAPYGVTNHPKNGSRRLLDLMWATPPCFHRSKTKVANFYCKPFMQENVCTTVKELHWGKTHPVHQVDTFLFFSINRHWKTNRKDTVWLHVSVNDVLCMKIAENEEKNNYIPVIVDLILRKKWDSVQLTPCPEQSAWQYLWAGSSWNLSPGHVCACRGCYPHTTVSQWPGCP